MNDRLVDKVCLEVDRLMTLKAPEGHVVVIRRVSQASIRPDAFTSRHWYSLSELLGDLRTRYGDVYMLHRGRALLFGPRDGVAYEPRMVSGDGLADLEEATDTERRWRLTFARREALLIRLWEDGQPLGPLLPRGLLTDGRDGAHLRPEPIPRSEASGPHGQVRVQTSRGTLVAEPEGDGIRVSLVVGGGAKTQVVGVTVGTDGTLLIGNSQA